MDPEKHPGISALGGPGDWGGGTRLLQEGRRGQDSRGPHWAVGLCSSENRGGSRACFSGVKQCQILSHTTNWEVGRQSWAAGGWCGGRGLKHRYLPALQQGD